MCVEYGTWPNFDFFFFLSRHQLLFTLWNEACLMYLTSVIENVARDVYLPRKYEHLHGRGCCILTRPTTLRSEIRLSLCVMRWLLKQGLIYKMYLLKLLVWVCHWQGPLKNAPVRKALFVFLNALVSLSFESECDVQRSLLFLLTFSMLYRLLY